jgi:four helix bundle protein
VAHSFKQLIIWQKSKRLAVDICLLVRRFPKDELYGMTSQIRRAAVSVPCNIAEGQGRLTKGEFVNFLGVARGSLLELETLLAISVDLGYLDQVQFAKLEDEAAEILRGVNGLIEAMRAKMKAAGA